MNVMIIGAGFTGVQLAKRLINEGNKVILIENNQDAKESAESRLECQVFLEDGNSLENLERHEIAKMDALVTLTESDEINMITCSLVDAVYPDILKIARVRNYAYYVNTNDAARHHAETFKGNHRPLYGIDYMIHPDVEAAEAIVKAVEHGAVSDILDFGEESEFELTALTVEKESSMDGVALKDLRNLTDRKFLVAYVETKDPESDNMVSSLPSGETVLHAGDRIGILISKENLPDLVELSGAKIDRIKKICLVGIGRVGTIVAERIIEKEKNSLLKKLMKKDSKPSQSITIIDTDKALCAAAEAKFPSARVLNADITDDVIIEEEGLHKYNLLICATHNHELNMVISAYLESLGLERSIVLVAQTQFKNIARRLGIEVAIPMRDTLIDSIISHLHGKSVTGIHTVGGGEFEIVECDLSASSRFVGKQLKDIANPGQYLVLLVKKPGDTKYEMASGNTTLSTGDHLVIIEKAGDKKVLDRFSK